MFDQVSASLAFLTDCYTFCICECVSAKQLEPGDHLCSLAALLICATDVCGAECACIGRV